MVEFDQFLSHLRAETQPFRGVWGAVDELCSGNFGYEFIPSASNGEFVPEALKIVVYNSRGETSYLLASPTALRLKDGDRSSVGQRIAQVIRRGVRDQTLDAQAIHSRSAKELLKKSGLETLGAVVLERGPINDYNRDRLRILFPKVFTSITPFPAFMSLFYIRVSAAEDRPISSNSFSRLPLV